MSFPNQISGIFFKDQKQVILNFYLPTIQNLDLLILSVILSALNAINCCGSNFGWKLANKSIEAIIYNSITEIKILN